jgi:hypothetical protein
MLIPRHVRITEWVGVIGHLRAYRVNNGNQLDGAQKPGEQQQDDGNNNSHHSSRNHEHPKASNAANHPPPDPAKVDNILRVGGRVHWLVRVRAEVMTHLPPPAILEARPLPRRPMKDNPKRGPRVRGWRLLGKEPRVLANRKPPSWV